MRPVARHEEQEEEQEEPSDRGKLHISRDFIISIQKLGEEEDFQNERRVQPETPKRGTWLGLGHSKGGGWSPGTKVHAL